MELAVGFGVLLVFQLIGEVISFWTGNLVPGPVIGMALFVCCAVVASKQPRCTVALRQAGSVADDLLANLGIMFVPAGVGVMQHLRLVLDRGVSLAIVLAISTVLTLAATVWTFLWVKRITNSEEEA